MRLVLVWYVGLNPLQVQTKLISAILFFIAFAGLNPLQVQTKLQVQEELLGVYIFVSIPYRYKQNFFKRLTNFNCTNTSQSPIGTNKTHMNFQQFASQHKESQSPIGTNKTQFVAVLGIYIGLSLNPLQVQTKPLIYKRYKEHTELSQSPIGTNKTLNHLS